MIRLSKMIQTGLLILLIGACKRDEFMPDPVGEQIAYEEESLESLDATVQSSSASLFAALWRRSTVKDILLPGELQYTVLMPDNNAMEAAGWNDSKIVQADQFVVDSLVGIHCFLNAIGVEHLESRSDTYIAETLFEKTNLTYKTNNSSLTPYRFRVGLGMDAGVLTVNEIPTETAGEIKVKEGRIWQINKLVEVPQQTAWEAIQADSRFSLYVALMEYTDALYKETFYEANGYYPEQATIVAAKAFDRNSPTYLDMVIMQDAFTGAGYTNSFNTWFIPTNDAFASAGYHSLDDLIAFNESRGALTTALVGSGENSYYAVRGEFATDSLLDYHHNWGRKVDNFSATRNRNASLFYPSDLAQGVMGDYPIAVSTTIINHLIFPLTDHTITTYLYIPFDFPEDGVLQLKSNVASRARVVDNGTNTLNGMVYGVDQLLKPLKFVNE